MSAMKRVRFKDTAFSWLRIPVPDKADVQPPSDDQDLIQKQLADTRKEEQEAMAEWRRYSTPYYEAVWNVAIAKVQRLEARIPKRKATFGG